MDDIKAKSGSGKYQLVDKTLSRTKLEVWCDNRVLLMKLINLHIILYLK